MNTRLCTLAGLVFFAVASLAVCWHFETLLFDRSIAISPAALDGVEYLANTWLAAFVISAAAAVWTLVGIITNRSSDYGGEFDEPDHEPGNDPGPEQQHQFQ